MKTTNIDPTTSAKFANMSIVCAFLVVCMHVGGGFAHGSFGWWFSELTRGGLSRVAVPYFFLASGFFLAGKYGSSFGLNILNVWKFEVVRRIRTLLVPLLLWPIIGMFLAVPFIMVANYISGRQLWHAVPFVNGTFWPGVGILWFIRFLIVLVLLSPVILFLVRRLGKIWLFVAFVAYWGVYSFVDPVTPYGSLGWCVYDFSLEGVAYFSTGFFLRLHDGLFVKLNGRFAYAMLLIGFALVLCSVSLNYLYEFGEGSNYLNLRHFPLPFLMAGMYGIMPDNRFPRVLASASFPVYLMHGIWAMPITCALNQLGIIPNVMQYLIKWVGAFGLSVLSAWRLRRYAPRLASVLFGGR